MHYVPFFKPLDIINEDNYMYFFLLQLNPSCHCSDYQCITSCTLEDFYSETPPRQ